MSTSNAGAPAAGGRGLPLWLLLAIVLLAWGGNWPITKLALADAPPLWFTATRITLAAVLIAVIARVAGDPILPDRPARARLAVIGLCQVALLLSLTTISLRYLPASQAVLIAYSLPLWTWVIGRMLGDEPPSRAKLPGLLIGFGGLVLLVGPQAMADWGSDPLLGAALVLISTLGWATGTCLYRGLPPARSFWPQLFWQIAVSVPPVWLAHFWFEPGLGPRWTGQLGFLLAYNVVVPMTLAFWCWLRVLKVMRASTASQMIMLAPVVGFTSSAWMFDEPLPPLLLVSAALILGGSWLTVRVDRAAARPAAR